MFSSACSEGYTEAQIVAVAGRYDVDIGRHIDRAELRKMQADLTRQKVSLFVFCLLFNSTSALFMLSVPRLIDMCILLSVCKDSNVIISVVVCQFVF